MTDAPPIACTLHPADAPEREAEIRSLGREALEGVDREPRRAVLRFSGRAGVRERVERVVAAESACCAFLAFDLADAGGVTVVTILAPAGGEAIMHELVDLFAPR
jgi:hypothetical protein